MEIERTKKVRTAEAGFNPLEDLSTRVGRQRGDGEDHRERERGGDGSDGRHSDGSFYSGSSFICDVCKAAFVQPPGLRMLARI